MKVTPCHKCNGSGQTSDPWRCDEWTESKRQQLETTLRGLEPDKFTPKQGTTMSNILAEVEGICNHKVEFSSGDSWQNHWQMCSLCGESTSPEQRKNPIPDYPNDLEACMRVARKMCQVVITNFEVGVIILRSHSSPHMTERAIDDPNNLAATLYPMLVEIAEERKG